MVVDMISTEAYKEKVYGGWMGKNIGGTLGGPLEGRKELMSYDFYPTIGDLPLPNDDLDLQLVWLHALETYGPRITSSEIALEWLDHVFFPYDEYGYSLTNMRRGMVPPVSGWYSNPFTNCMGSPIRSEIWAMIAPGQPHLAAYYAYQDAVTDHAGGEGVYGEMFFAAVESAAFTTSDPRELLEIGLSVIPPDCRTARAASDTVRWHAEGLDWVETRNRIIEKHGHVNFTDAPQNIAFTVLGLLYGQDFGDAICKAVNCGYDTDCTGATLGAILGIILGVDGLPAKWKEPVGDMIVVSPPVKGFPAPKTVLELTERTARVAAEVAAFQAHRPVPEPASLWSIRPNENRFYYPDSFSPSLEAIVSYDSKGPVAFPGTDSPLKITLINHSSERWYGALHFHLPSGWSGGEPQSYSLAPGAQQELSVTLHAGGELQPDHLVEMEITRLHNDARWQSIRQPLLFAQAMRWQVETPEAVTKKILCPTNKIPFDKTCSLGTYRLSSDLICPSAREARLMVATACPVRVWLNERLVFDHWQAGSGIPAYHRGQGAPVRIEAGTNPIVIEIDRQSDLPKELYVACVAPHKVPEPGSMFAYLDVMFV